MNDELDYKSNPLHGVGLKKLLNEIVDHYGYDVLFAYVNIKCFKTNPSIESSIKFLKKTDWAREAVEAFYLYEYKNLPSASADQSALPPRDRIIPEGQVSGRPAKLSVQDANRLREKRERRSAERQQGTRHRPEPGSRTAVQRSVYPDHPVGRRVQPRDDDSRTVSEAPPNGAFNPWKKRD